MSKITWTYGVTTVLERRTNLLPRTLASLAKAGFDSPRLFIDGATLEEAMWYRAEFGLEITVRTPRVKTFGNWTLALGELYLRSPASQRFAVFQDDLVTYPNLRQYLDRVPFPETGYWNLYTVAQNQVLALKGNGPDGRALGWFPSNQKGKGAVGLVFNRQGVLTCLTHKHMVERPLDAERGWKAIDGGIVSAFRKAGWTEYCHNPSLVQHTGDTSSMGNKLKVCLHSESFRGEEFDALSLLDAPAAAPVAVE